MSKVFISGPMFSPADLWEQKQIKNVVEAAGFTTYYAPEDGIEDEELIADLQSPLMASANYRQAALVVQRIGWTLDIYMATFGCDAMVMNMNGRVPDEGSVVEAANAYACGMPLVLYKDTSITMWGPFDNPMVAALTANWTPVTSYEAIPPALSAAIAGRDASYTYLPPPSFAQDLAVGKHVAEHRDHVMDVLRTLSRSGQDIPQDTGSMWALLLQEIGITEPSARQPAGAAPR